MRGTASQAWASLCTGLLLSSTPSAQHQTVEDVISGIECAFHAQYVLEQLEGSPLASKFQEATHELAGCALQDDGRGGMAVYRDDQLLLTDSAQADVLMALSHALSWGDEACPAALRRACGKHRGKCVLAPWGTLAVHASVFACAQAYQSVSQFALSGKPCVLVHLAKDG